MTIILLVRHAEVHNPQQLLYGRLPRFGLSERGRGQAEALAAFLADRPIAAIYTSPLLRARQTASAIARYHPGLRVRQSTLLQEVASVWQGTPLEPGFSTYDNRREPADESMDDVRKRMERFIARVRRCHPGGCVVAVSHGDPITILRVALRRQLLTLAAIRGGNYAGLCSITEIVFRSGETCPRVTCLTVPDLSAS